jgi:hypothetical protein
MFDVYVPITIQTVNVYASNTASRTIFLKNSSEIEIDSLTTTISSGAKTVTLNFNVPAGTGYTLGCSANNNLWREITDASFPYTISGVLSITGNTVPDAVHYYYFYDWQVTGSYCLSPMTEVSMSVCGGINELTKDNDVSLYPNPSTGQITVNFSLYQQNVLVNIYDVLGDIVKTVYANDLTDKLTIDMNHSLGFYTMVIKTTYGDIIRRFIIE